MVTNFIYGDELGNIKSVKYAPSNETSIQTLLKSPTAKLNSVQLLSLEPAPQEALTSPLVWCSFTSIELFLILSKRHRSQPRMLTVRRPPFI